METTESILNATRVEEILVDCLFKDDEPTDDAVKAQGVMLNIGFHPGRLDGHKDEIGLMLHELPEDFHDEKGGGMSFLNACMTKDDVHWAEHQTIDKLLVLGIATGQAKILLPREMWHVFPGGMPYFSVNKLPSSGE